MNFETASDGSSVANELPDVNMEEAIPVPDAALGAQTSDDLADSVPGLFRILDLVYEQGSSGLGWSSPPFHCISLILMLS